MNLIGDSTTTPTLSFSRFDLLTDQVGGRLVGDDAFVSSLTEKIVTEELVNRVACALAAKASDPFDSIYISDLKPDMVSGAALQEIDRATGIKDVSDAVTFGDDLD